jgi:hypothetical protein
VISAGRRVHERDHLRLDVELLEVAEIARDEIRQRRGDREHADFHFVCGMGRGVPECGHGQHRRNEDLLNKPWEPNHRCSPIHQRSFRRPEARAQRASKGDGPSVSAASFEARLRRAPQDDG